MSLPSESFDFAPRPRIVFGTGVIGRLGLLVRELGGTRVLLVTDPGIVRAGHAARAEESLAAAGLKTAVFDRVVENPTTKTIDECLAVARRERIDFFVGLGGGSSLDTAKGCNFLLTNGGRMEDYWGAGKAMRPMLPMIAVPTTAGTGSECQSFALIAQEATHVKMACGDPKAAPRLALLDPELTLTQPREVAAAAGIDAISHAVESAVTRRRNAISEMFAREAFRRCASSFGRILSDPEDLTARGEMLLGAALAGLAIENSMLGAAHAAANPLTAHFDVVHGRAVGLMLPAVVRYNGQCDATRRIYEELALAGGVVRKSGDPIGATHALADFLERCLQVANLPGSLAAMEIHAPELDRLADEASRQWTAQFNPRPVGREEFVQLYETVRA